MRQFLKHFRLFALILSIPFFIQSCTEDDDADGGAMIEAGFTFTLDEDTGVVSFINTSTNADTYSWDFGDQTSSSEINPTKVYETGTYDIVLTASNAAGATDTFTDQIVINIPLQISLPFNFDMSNVIYEATTFNGAAFEVVANPAPGGSNDVASNVGAITNSGVNWEGLFFELGAPIDLSVDMTVQMDFWSETPIDILMKLEAGSGPDTETVASHGGTGWENLIFTFNSGDSFNTLTLFVDGPGTTSGTFYFDNVRQTSTIDVTAPVITLNGDATVTLTAGEDFTDPGATALDNTDGDITANIIVAGDAVDTDTPGTYVITYDVMDAAGNAATQVVRTVIVEPCSATNNLEFPIEFDCPTIDYTGKIVGNVNFTVVDNPAPGGSNDMASSVGQITNVGANWENAFFNLDVPLDFSMGQGIRMDFWSDQAVPILLKYEDGTAGPVEVSMDHSGSGWEELTFVFTSDASFNDMVIFVDGPGTTAGTFYVDNLEQFQPDTGGGGGDESPLCLTEVRHLDTGIEDSAILLSIYNSGTNQLTAEIESANPDAYGVDFLQVLPVGLPPVNSTTVVDGKITVTIDYDSPPTTAEFAEVLWSTTIFDGNWLQNVVTPVPFDATCDTSGGGGGGGGGGSEDTLIIDFENNLAGVTPSEFETSGALVANPVSGGINTSPNVYQASYSDANQWWGGIGLTFADGVLDQSTTVYKGKFYSTVAPTNVLFQVEVDGTNAPVGNVQEITTANEWVELTFTLANIPAGVNRILVRPDVGDQNGTKPNTGTLYIDDIFSSTDGGGGGGGGGGSTGGCDDTPIPATSFPVDFEGCESFTSSFGDSISSSLADNPDQSGINPSSYAFRIDKPAGSQFWEGVQNNFPDTFPDISTRKFTMKIWSSKPNTTFRFEVAQDDPGIGNPPGAFATVTEANTWTEVEVIFSAIPSPESYFRFVIKPDNDEMDSPITSDGTYYIDDINLVSQ